MPKRYNTPIINLTLSGTPTPIIRLKGEKTKGVGDSSQPRRYLWTVSSSYCAEELINKLRAKLKEPCDLGAVHERVTDLTDLHLGDSDYIFSIEELRRKFITHDLFQIEDDEKYRMFLSSNANLVTPALTYWGVESLGELEDSLSKGDRGRFYILDMNFPRIKGGRIEMLAREGTDLIRAHDQGAEILFYTNDSDKGPRLADELRIRYVGKSMLAKEIVEMIHQRLKTR